MIGQKKVLMLFCIGLFALILAPLVCAYDYSGNGAEATVHCLRQDIARTIAPTYEMANSYGSGWVLGPEKSAGNIQFVYTVPIGTTFYFRGLKSLLFACDNPYVTVNWINYVDLYNNNTGEILATDGRNNNEGPINQDPTNYPSNYCVTASDNQTICYKNNGAYIPAVGTCSRSADVTIGGGWFDSSEPDGKIFYDFNTPGEYDISLRLGVISPHGFSSYSPYIMHTEIARGKFFVENPSMAVLTPPSPRKINSFNNSGSSTEEVFFTLNNTSHYTEKIENYTMNCPTGVTCSVGDTYKGFTINPGQSMVVPATVTFSLSGIPKEIKPIKLNVTYSAIANNGFGSSYPFTATSNEIVFQVGFLDQQDFQIEVVGEEKNYCIADDGTVGKTGELVVPRVNLSFGGNESPNKPLISIDECSPENPEWVYCSQREFLVQLSEKLQEINRVKIALNAAQQDLYLAQSTNDQSGIAKANALIKSLMDEDSNLSSFNAYLRRQDISASNISESLSMIQNMIFTNIGFYDSNKIKFDELIKSINFEKAGITGDKTIEAGMHKVMINIAQTGEVNYSNNYLFLPSGELNHALNITVSLEKKSNPSYNWFFYEDDSTDSFAEKINELANNRKPNAYASNVQDRGLVMDFNKAGSTINFNKFYKTYADPLFIKVTGNSNGDSDADLAVSGYFSGADTFTYWSGFASTQSNGCETTSASPPGGVKTLPYRVPDSNLNNKFVIPEFSKVVPNSKIYLETVIYLPEETQVTLDKARFYSNLLNNTPLPSNGVGAPPNENPNDMNASILTLKSTTSLHKVNSVADVFSKIRSEEICVANQKIGPSSEKWILFWNQQKILNDLNVLKQGITDANLCDIRQDLSS